MNAHEHALILAATTIDFEIAPDERAELARHLAGCAGCRADVAGFRVDAEVIGGLPMLRHDHSHATSPAIVGALGRTMRLVLVSALVALLAGAAVFAGAWLLQRWNEVVPPPISTASPSPAEPTQPVPTQPVPTQPVPTTTAPIWNVQRLDVAAMDGHSFTSGLAYANGRYVAVGGRDCDWPDPPVCWGGVWTSTDGTSWEKLERSSPLAVSTALTPSGPEPGLLDVAGGPGGFVAIGYGLQVDAAIWFSPDGLSWQLATSDLAASARVHAVAATPTGWAVVGEVFQGVENLATGTPRAAIWTSTDGLTWGRVPDGPMFDIGRYQDTMEEPSTGGIRDIASDGTTVLAVGASCFERGLECFQATWRSANGLTWERLPDGPAGSLTGVAAGTLGFRAVGPRCDTETAPYPCEVLLQSWEGGAWTVVRQEPSVEYLATAATDRFVVVVMKDESGAGKILASVDGLAWQELDKALAGQNLGLRGVGMTAGPRGAIVVLGWGDAGLDWGAFGASIELAR